MKKRLLSVLAFALVVSAGAAFVLYQLIASKVNVGASTKAPTTTKVFVAARDLELGTLVQEKDIATQEYLAPPAGSILKKEDIVGRGVINPIHQDMAFYDVSLGAKGAGGGFAATIPKGMRAFAVHVNEVVGVAGFAVAGMHVDVLVSGAPGGRETRPPVPLRALFSRTFRCCRPGRIFKRTRKVSPCWCRSSTCWSRRTRPKS